MSRPRAIGLFGGTFNPVHIGHLRTALELRELLNLDEMRLLPSALPPHRDEPEVSARQRADMVSLAIAGEPGLVLDERELHRMGPSWTLDTLREVRAELGAEARLSFCIGMDSLVSLASWHRWHELTSWAHLVVAARPGWSLPAEGEVAEWLGARRAENAQKLFEQPQGGVLITELTLLPVAATDLRTRISNVRSVRYLTPDTVLDYIKKHQLYR